MHPWYLNPDALTLLSDCAREHPIAVPFSHQYALTRDEWREYDDEDERVVALSDIRERILTPILNDPVNYRRADDAGLMVDVRMAIDAVTGMSAGGSTTYYHADVARVSAQIDHARKVAA